ncbi:MAG: molybdopterin molybdotransferase MoeA, partial [Armatimonadota bacterium]|nr:molybdopterin molybdotransferase MoeA [Armatimonadota bacterium]
MEHNSPPQSFWPQATAEPISFAKAVSIVAAQAEVILSGSLGEPQKCELPDALGCVLAVAVAADRDQPPFPRVTRDGFALRAQDLASGTPLRVVGQLRAGESWLTTRPALRAGQAIEIMTGAALPPGADAVLMVEHAEEIAEDAGDRTIIPRAGRTLRSGENVVPRGSEARQEDVLLQAGMRLGPEEIALAAACGLGSVLVRPAPRVAILATGDELIEPAASKADVIIAPHQIYDSNSHALAALVRQAHAVPLRLRAARDRRDDLEASILDALKAAPLLLLSGGVSMGRYDLVEEVLASLGAEFFFTGVKMQPGKPVVFGRVPAGDGLPPRFFFGLPGNPVSTMVTFRVFVQPLLAALAGERNWQPHIALAILSRDVECKPELTRFLPARLD